jgi:hypothetical protein
VRSIAGHPEDANAQSTLASLTNALVADAREAKQAAPVDEDQEQLAIAAKLEAMEAAADQRAEALDNAARDEAMRALYASGDWSIRKLAARFGLSVGRTPAIVTKEVEVGA